MPHQLCAFGLRAPLWDMAFSTDGQLIFLSRLLSNPHGTCLCFKGRARNWAMLVDLKEAQAHFCPQTNLPDSYMLPCWQNHARTSWLCLGFQMGLRKQGEPCANVGMGLGLVMVMDFILHSQFPAPDSDFLVLPWFSGLWVALQRAVQFLAGLSSPCWKDKAPALCPCPAFLRNLGGEGRAGEARKGKHSSLMIVPSTWWGLDCPDKAKTQPKGLVFATNLWLFCS